MKRSGFTMIELIFVIVILGILAAVALPKFIGVSEQANVGKAKAFIGTLNRTVAPALWADSIGQGDNGNVATGGGALGAGVLVSDLQAQMEVPDIGDTGAKLAYANLSGCGSAGPTIPAVGTTGGAVAGYTVWDTFDIGTTTYDIYCSNGNTVNAPQFWLVDNGTGNVLAK